jgi:DNA-binding transcriptional ArsR family regulator
VKRKDVQFEVLKLQAELCKALSDPRRLQVIRELRGGARAVGELSALLGLSQSNTSQHLAVLRRVGVISPRRDGTTIYYELVIPKVAEACDLVHDVIAGQLRSQKIISKLM